MKFGLNTPNIADVCVAPYFQTLHRFEWTAMYEQDFPKVTVWYARCRARDSYQASVAADFSEEKLEDLRAKGTEARPKIHAHLTANDDATKRYGYDVTCLFGIGNYSWEEHSRRLFELPIAA